MGKRNTAEIFEALRNGRTVKFQGEVVRETPKFHGGRALVAGKNYLHGATTRFEVEVSK